MGQVVKDIPSGGSFRTNQPELGKFVSNNPISGSIDKTTEGYVYLENKTITVGEPMGLLLSLTYPNTFSFIGERT